MNYAFFSLTLCSRFPLRRNNTPPTFTSTFYALHAPLQGSLQTEEDDDDSSVQTLHPAHAAGATPRQHRLAAAGGGGGGGDRRAPHAGALERTRSARAAYAGALLVSL
jgi:hypothetical protein